MLNDREQPRQMLEHYSLEAMAIMDGHGKTLWCNDDFKALAAAASIQQNRMDFLLTKKEMGTYQFCAGGITFDLEVRIDILDPKDEHSEFLVSVKSIGHKKNTKSGK